jgi:TolA-binding protein
MTQRLITLALLVLLLASGAHAADGAQVPPEDALWRAAGEAYSHGQDKSAAMQQYRLFVDTYDGSPRAAAAQFMVGECYQAVGDWEAALREYGQVDRYPGRDDYLEASVLLREGECLFNLARFDDAIERYKTLVDRYDDTFLLAEGLYQLGQAYIVQGNWLRLEEAYRELLERRPGYADLQEVKFALGLFAFHDGRFDDARAYFEEVPSDRGLYFLGRTLEETGQYILAIQRYKQVLRRYADSPLADDVAFSIAEAFYHSGQNAVAVRSYRDFLEQYPRSPFVPNARYKMACVTFREGRYDESMRQLEQIVQGFPDAKVVAYAQYLIGDCCLQLERPSEAIFAWTDVVRRFPESTVASAALHKIVFAYAQEGNHGQAIVLANEFLDRFPGDHLAPRVRVLKGFSHFQLEEYKQALMAFQNVVDKHVNTDVAERALFLSTLAYTRLGQLDRVLTNYNYLASKLLPTPSHWRARTYYHLGEAYFAQGLYREAAGMYRLVLTGYPRANVAAPSLQGLVASLSRAGEDEVALQEQERFLLVLANAESEGGTNSLAVGSIYFNQHNYEDALQQFTDFLQNNPEDPAAATALANQADCYYRLQYYEQAIEAWRGLLARFPQAPEAPEALYRVADTQFGLGRFEDAARSYSRLRQQYAEGEHAADAAFGLANCAYNLGQDDLAISRFTEFVETWPEDPRTEDAELGIQSCYYRSGKDMTEYLARRPESALAADVYWNKGQEAFAAGRFGEAADSFERVTLDYPDSESAPGALFYLAESYYRAESHDQALAGFCNFTTTHPEHDLAELAQLRVATVLFKLDRYAEAAVDYETLTDLFPDGEYAPLAAYNAAICYQELEEWHAAIGSLERFAADYPEHENARGVWLQIAALYQEELGDWPRAVDAYERAAAQAGAPLAEVRYRQGECLTKAGDLDGALARFETAAGSGEAVDPFRIAALAEIGRIAEERGDWNTAIGAYERIIAAGGKAEWTQMAEGRITAIREAGVTTGG